MDRVERQTEIDFLCDCFSKAQIALCADYRGMNVGQISGLRRDLRQQGQALGRVVKNTLAKKAIEKTYSKSDKAEIEKFTSLFDGPSLLVLSYKDQIAPTKVLAKYGKDHESFNIKGGWIDGKFVDAKGVESLSKMPSKEETLGKLLALISAPATQLLRLLNAPASQLVQVLEAHRGNLEKKGA